MSVLALDPSAPAYSPARSRNFTLDFAPDDIHLIRPGDRLLVDREEWGTGERDPSQSKRVQQTMGRSDVRIGRRADGTVFVQGSTAGRHDGFTRDGKRFTRWSTTNVRIVTGRPGEPLLEKTYQSSFGWSSMHHFSDRSTSRFRHTPFGRAQRFVDMLLPEPPSMWDYYPLLGHYIDREFSDANVDWWSRNPAMWAPGGLRNAFTGARNAHDLTRHVFGTRRYCFDLVTATGRADLYSLCLAWQFRGLVPAGTLIDLLGRRHEFDVATPPLIRDHLLTLSPTPLLALATGDLPSQYLLTRISPLRPVTGLPEVTAWEDLYYEIGMRTPAKNPR